jgi:hypothetical protein
VAREAVTAVVTGEAMVAVMEAERAAATVVVVKVVGTAELMLLTE